MRDVSKVLLHRRLSLYILVRFILFFVASLVTAEDTIHVIPVSFLLAQ